MNNEKALIAKIDKLFETNSVMTRTEFNQLLLSLKRERATAFQANNAQVCTPKLSLITLAAINSSVVLKRDQRAY